MCVLQLEAHVSDLSRENNDLESRIEEDQDEIEELLDRGLTSHRFPPYSLRSPRLIYKSKNRKRSSRP